LSGATTIIWRPSAKAFAKRAALGSFILCILINGVGIFSNSLTFDLLSLLKSLASIAFSVLFYMLIFDEWQNWNRHRDEEWRLSEFSLGFRDVGSSMEFDEFRLADVKSVTRSFWRGVKVRMKDRRAFMMSYLANPKQVQSRIQQQVAKLQPEVTA
jgi:hypothetical protein